MAANQAKGRRTHGTWNPWILDPSLGPHGPFTHGYRKTDQPNQSSPTNYISQSLDLTVTTSPLSLSPFKIDDLLVQTEFVVVASSAKLKALYKLLHVESFDLYTFCLVCIPCLVQVAMLLPADESVGTRMFSFLADPERFDMCFVGSCADCVGLPLCFASGHCCPCSASKLYWCSEEVDNAS